MQTNCYLTLGLANLLYFASAQWTDTSLLTSTTFHGPDLKWKGDVTVDGNTYIRKVGVSYVAKSVITGKDSFFPASLPSSLRKRFLYPDSTHPNLAFWFTPDVFDEAGEPDGKHISAWKNVANICYYG
eukprot:758559-Hanusia_phi.AAC.3